METFHGMGQHTYANSRSTYLVIHDGKAAAQQRQGASRLDAQRCAQGEDQVRGLRMAMAVNQTATDGMCFSSLSRRQPPKTNE